MSYRSWALWFLGYPQAALANSAEALTEAREIGQATEMFALVLASQSHGFCGNYAAATAQLDEVVALADEMGALLLKAAGMVFHGCVLALTSKSSEAVGAIASGMTAWQSRGATLFVPFHLLCLARADTDLGKIDDAWRCIGEALSAVEITKETWCEAEVHRVAGEIALLSPGPDARNAEGYFKRALSVARQQQAKSWELRAAMSMARLWRDQGKRDEALNLLAPVYGWFTEGFDTLDLKEAKALLEELHA